MNNLEKENNFQSATKNRFPDFTFSCQTDQVAEQMEKKIIVDALEESAYIITDSAERLQVDQQFLLEKMKQYRL
ncbi:MAG: helix-turn-helix domain-containing protein [Candidatus Cloacimonadales bacterium]